MNFDITFTHWDALLLVVVTGLATLVAYLHQPRWKAIALSVPLPFTCATLALGKPVDVTQISGLVLLLAFINAVRLLHCRLRVPIVASIAIPAVAYAALGMALARVLPVGAISFWIGVGAAAAAAGSLHAVMPPRKEPGHRSPLPLWLKLPIIAGVVLLLIVIKQLLRGFMAMFPMVTLITAYEARHSLWTVCRQLNVFGFAFVGMIVTIWLVQQRLSLGVSLAAGWIVFLLVIVPLTWKTWFSIPEIQGTSYEQP